MNERLEIHFINVAGGDCIIVAFFIDNNLVENMIVDCGERNSHILEYSSRHGLCHRNDYHFDTALLTHHHDDHANFHPSIRAEHAMFPATTGAMSAGFLQLMASAKKRSRLFDRNRIGEFNDVVTTSVASPGKADDYKSQSQWIEGRPFEKFLDFNLVCGGGCIADQRPIGTGRNYKQPKMGWSIPESHNFLKDPNALSVGFSLEWKGFKFFSAGDVGFFDEKLAEKIKEIFPKGVTLFKSNHHGSRRGIYNNDELLLSLSPSFTVVTAWPKFGLPESDFINTSLKNPNAKIYITNKCNLTLPELVAEDKNINRIVNCEYDPLKLTLTNRDPISAVFVVGRYDHTKNRVAGFANGKYILPLHCRSVNLTESGESKFKIVGRYIYDDDNYQKWIGSNNLTASSSTFYPRKFIPTQIPRAIWNRMKGKKSSGIALQNIYKDSGRLHEMRFINLDEISPIADLSVQKKGRELWKIQEKFIFDACLCILKVTCEWFAKKNYKSIVSDKEKKQNVRKMSNFYWLIEDKYLSIGTKNEQINAFSKNIYEYLKTCTGSKSIRSLLNDANIVCDISTFRRNINKVIKKDNEMTLFYPDKTSRVVIVDSTGIGFSYKHGAPLIPGPAKPSLDTVERMTKMDIVEMEIIEMESPNKKESKIGEDIKPDEDIL